MDSELARLYALSRDALFEQRDEDAEALAREALQRAPDDARVREHLGMVLLRQGRWPEGWQFLESRTARQAMLAQRPPMPEWQGEPLNGRSIMACGEQGIGDEIQMGRFLPALRDLGADRVTVGCLAPLTRAFPLLGADVAICRNGQRLALQPPDCWVMLGFLPHRLGVTAETLSGTPYLRPSRMGGGGIGLVERGNPRHPHDAHRSIPQGMLRAAFPDARLMEPRGDILDSLAQLARLDLLITVDTSWAHMAGALGVPVWILLPFCGLDWRWMRGRPDTPWYRSARLFRQAHPGDWPGVIGEVRAALSAL